MAVTRPTQACRRSAARSVTFEIFPVAKTETAEKARNTSASHTLRQNIIAIEPTIMPTADSSCKTPVCIASDALSRSLVTCVRIEPGLFLSKKASGRRFSLSAMAQRRR